MDLKDIAIFLLLINILIVASVVKKNQDDIKAMQVEITQLKQTCSVYGPAPILTTEGE